MATDADILARLDRIAELGDRIESKLDEILAFVRLVQTDEYREKQNENDFQINVIADLFVEILEDIRDRKDNGTDIRKEN